MQGCQAHLASLHLTMQSNRAAYGYDVITPRTSLRSRDIAANDIEIMRGRKLSGFYRDKTRDGKTHAPCRVQLETIVSHETGLTPENGINECRRETGARLPRQFTRPHQQGLASNIHRKRSHLNTYDPARNVPHVVDRVLYHTEVTITSVVVIYQHHAPDGTR
ncbi:hypothetical protein APE01nite_13990 [Acetobacter peroxydans]|uniref:Uncharacterized protein n=1 Tax=Acetobacter peroxydans TaxID=104098 RepID=A0A4Y3TUR8_9PROT|nr:hypothetical protein APE01nite_13990 [Acetobacter peroxydans]